MCGIFGVVGEKTSPSLLIQGLKQLEYRGYDSWGIALADSQGLTVSKETGRISQQASPIEVSNTPWGGIAHTRWATHGVPSAKNAHPHLARNGKLAIVHNGIIENHTALRRNLRNDGYELQSDTDSEVIAHLVERFLGEGMELLDAFLGTLKLLEGTYGIALIDADHPGQVFVARKGSPLVIGIAENGMIISSDPTALVAHTHQVVFLGDDEAAVVQADSYWTCDLSAVEVRKEVEELAFNIEDTELNSFEHYMLKEIYEQPETIRNALRGRLIRHDGMACLGGIDNQMLRNVKRCQILACGTSWHAALIGKYMIENLARVPTEVSYAAEFRYSNPIMDPDTLVIAISQSGETADTLAGLREAKLQGVNTIGICNVVGSAIARESGQGVYLHAGPEIGVASTKAFTSQLTVLAVLALQLGRLRGMGLTEALQFLDALEKLPDQVEQTLKLDDQIRELAKEFTSVKNCLYIGRLYEYPVALEGALKLKEISYIHAEGIPAAEMKHGPIALIDEQMPTVVLAGQGAVLDKMLANVEEIKARKGRIIAITREDDCRMGELADVTLSIPGVPDPLSPILSVVPLQLLAYHVAVLLGKDVDRPRNLAKSVTVE